jgi:hypothetical protein
MQEYLQFRIITQEHVRTGTTSTGIVLAHTESLAAEHARSLYKEEFVRVEAVL